MKKIFAILMAIVMMAAIAVPTLAAGEGSITINSVTDGVTYKVYKMLDLESYNAASGAYSYLVNPAWASFFTEGTGALNYMSIEASEPHYVTWIGGDSATAKETFAKLALDYAEANGIAPVKSSENAGEFVVSEGKGVFSNLDLGYYLVDSSMGALCGLTTTNPNAYIDAKNGIPTVDKQVMEDSTSNWGSANTADIGQDIFFKVTISVHPGAQNYVLHELLPAGLTFKGVTKVEHVIPDVETHEVEATKYTVLTGSTVTDGHTFDVVFSNEVCEELETNDKLVVYYTAMLNRNAVIAGAGNVNTAYLTFGTPAAGQEDAHKSNEDTTVTYTFGVDIIKTDSQNILLDGATFKIYNAETGGTEVPVVLMDDGVTYRRARADETGVVIDVNDGKARIVGFDNGTYYLEEVDAPDGYNKLTSRTRFIISDNNLYASFSADGTYSVNSGVQVVNKTGSMLPETGGLGTTIFMTVGGLLVLGAGVILFAKKRMAQIAE